MLPGIKNDLMYLLNILESIEKINLYTSDCSDAETFYYQNEQMNIGKISNELKQKLAKEILTRKNIR